MIFNVLLVLSLAFAAGSGKRVKCPNGFKYVNGETNDLMYDDRDVKKCKEEGFTACIKIKYDYETPELSRVKAEWDMPCFNPRNLPSFDLNTLFPAAALPLDINLQVCMDKECVDFKPEASTGLTCNSGVIVRDDDSGEVLVNDIHTAKCKAHQTGCFALSQTVTQNGRQATRIVKDCYDEWRSFNFIWDNFYPYTDFSGGYCEKFGCIAFKIWHKGGFDTRTCYCNGDNKPPGTYGERVMETCQGNMCN